MAAWGFNHFPELAVELRRQLHEVIYKTAFDIEADAASMAPVDTGFLKNSIHTWPVDDYEAEVAVGAEYGIYVEMGTRFMPAQPYFYPAIEHNRPAFEDALSLIAETLGDSL